MMSPTRPEDGGGRSGRGAETEAPRGAAGREGGHGKASDSPSGGLLVIFVFKKYKFMCLFLTRLFTD